MYLSQRTIRIVLILAISALGTACATTAGNTPVEKRASIKAMSTEVLNDLYDFKPAARQEIAASPGYGVFNNANINIIFASLGGGHADAAAKAGDKGGAVSAEALIDRVTVYQLTESGLALQATVKGTKFWVDKELN